MMKKVKKLLVNIFILTATSLLIRTVGVSFSAYLFNRIGATAIGTYGLILSVYGFAITLATSGIKFTVTRLTSEELGKNNEQGMKKIVRKALVYALGFSTVTGVILFWGADVIASYWLDNEETVLSLRILAVGLPFIAVSHVLSGYFTAIRKVVTGSVIMIIDQFVMIGITLLALTWLLPKGIAYACLALVLGSILSEVITCLLLCIEYGLEGKRREGVKHTGYPISGVWRRLLAVSLPIAFSAYARSGLYTLQNLLIPKGLRKYGASGSEALASYGTIHGMVLPMVLYPSALMIALSELLIPELTECQVQQNYRQINYIINRVLKMSFLFTACVMGILFYFAEDLSGLFQDHPEVAFYLKVFAPLVLVMYMDTVVDGLLKGLGEQLKSMQYNVIDSFVSVLLVFFLIPIFGIRGYVFTVMVSELLNFVLSLSRLIKVTQVRINLLDVVIKPLLCIAGAVTACTILLSDTNFISQFLPQGMVIHMAMMVGFYVCALFLTSCLKREELRWVSGVVR